jgi:hypothetical protein
LQSADDKRVSERLSQVSGRISDNRPDIGQEPDSGGARGLAAAMRAGGDSRARCDRDLRRADGVAARH